MFGIPDPQIWLVYILSVICVAFAAWFGIKFWNEEDEEGEISSLPRRKKNKKTYWMDLQCMRLSLFIF